MGNNTGRNKANLIQAAFVLITYNSDRRFLQPGATRIRGSVKFGARFFRPPSPINSDNAVNFDSTILLMPSQAGRMSKSSTAGPRFLGIEIGGTKLQLVTGDESGRLLERCRFTVEKENGAAGIRAQIGEG